MANNRDVWQAMTDVLRKQGEDISADLKTSAGNAGIRRRTGLMGRGFRPSIRYENGTYIPWGLAFSTKRYTFILNAGVKSQSYERKGKVVRTRGFEPRGFLQKPMEDGAKKVADALSREIGNFVVTDIWL